MANSLQKDIMEKIKSGEIEKRPGWIFKFEYVLGYVLLAILGLVVVFFSSAFIYFVMDGEIYTHFNLERFLLATPWETLIAIGIVFVSIIVLFANISLHYRLGWLKILFCFVILVCLSVIIAEILNLHSRMQNNSILLKYYEGEGTFGDNRTNFVKGKIEQIDQSTVIVEDIWGNVWRLNRDDQNIDFAKNLEKGSSIKVIGQKKSGVVKVKCIDEYDKFQKLATSIKCPF